MLFLMMLLLSFSNTTFAGSFTASGTTLTLNLDVASQVVTVVSTGTTYTFTLSGGATNTWTGTTSTSVTVSGAVLTVTATGLTTFGTINITDSQTGTAVTFNTSAANTYADNFNITLDNTPGAVTFNGSSSFTGSNAINVTTSMYVKFSALSSLKTANGNLTLDANTQATPNNFSYSGITVDSSTVEITGTGILTMSARGGTGSSTGYGNNGIAVLKGGIVKGGTTGTTSINGWGYTGFAGTASNIYACGVMVVGKSPTVIPTITSNGSNVSITGYGAISTAAPATATTIIGHVGVSVGTPQYFLGTSTSPATTYSGLITSGGSGTVTINGYGGKSASLSSGEGYKSSCIGVGVFGPSTTITSGGAGKVTITGTGGGPDTLSEGNGGVSVTGNITSGTNADLEVIGYQGISKSTSNAGGLGLGGVYIYGNNAFIRAGVGTGNTRVVGTGAANTAGSSNSKSCGVYLHTGGTISSLGSGNVTVIGYGGGTELGSATNNKGVLLSGTSASTAISSNGGNVRVEGTGGGYSIGISASTGTFNSGVELTTNGSISAGGMGSVTVIGIGGNNNGNSGTKNYGVYLSSFGSGQAEAYITSNGGDITVTGTGGGGNASSASGSSSPDNYGVYTEAGSYITAGGTGNVTVTGTGGNTSVGGTGANNYGVFVGPFAAKGTTNVYNTRITSSGGNVIINGTGGGNGASATNYGVYNKGLIKATGAGTVSITGIGGNTSGSANNGVYVDGAVTVLSVLYPATISSEGGNVTVTGTGGTVTSGSSSGSAYGVYLNGTTTTGGGGSIITAGGSGNVIVTGYGGQNLATSGDQNYGVYVNTGLSPNFSTITSSGGNVTVTGTAGGGSGASANSSNSNYGVFLLASGSITAGANGTVTVTGNGGNNSTSGTGGTNYGVRISGGTTPYFSKITSNNGVVNITGNGGGSGGLSASNHGVYVSSAGQITSAGAATAVTVNGTGSSSSGATNHGILVTGANSIITSGGGNVAINGTEGSSATSLALSLAAAGAISTATNGGNLTISGNSFGSVAGTSIAAKSDGVVNIIPKTSGTTVGFASTTDARGSIYINTAEMATITGGTINIGNSSTGPISISQAVTVPTGSNLNLATASSSAGLNPKLDGTEITMAAGKILGLSGIPSLNIAIGGATVNTQYDQFKVVGDVTLTGKTLSLSGTYTPVAGNVFTIVDATSVTGTFTGLANGATVTFNGVNLTINYTSTAVTLTAPCINPTIGGTIDAAQSGYNPFTPAAFTSSADASGQFGTVEYKWQSSTTDATTGFSDITTSNTATYTAGALIVTTWFKRLARVDCAADWTGAAESNVIEMTVIPCTNPTAGGTIAAAQSGTSPFNPAAFTSSVAASGETGTIEYKWQSSTTSNSAGFADIASSNAATYTAGALTQTTWYKRLARVSCSTDWTGAVESNVLEVTIISLATQPLIQPTNLFFTNTGTSSPYNIVSNFTASSSAAGYIVVRKTGAAPSFVPVDGTSYSAGAQGSDEIVYVGSLTSATDYAATDAVDYNYTIYAYNGSGGSINYLTTSPLAGKAINKTSNTSSVGNTTQSTSAGFPTAGVNVTFPNGTTGSTISATKNNSVPASNFSVLPGVRGVVNQYFTITSSNASPGTYTLILDFSSLGLTTSAWNNFKILKRANATAPWVNIIDLGATIANRQTDGVWGKFTITGLTSFSQFTGGAASSTITVTSAAETGTGTLKQAILDATDGDLINFDVSAMGGNTITLTSPVVINKDLTIQGIDGGIILDGNNVTRVIDIADTKVVRLERLKIVNGNGNVGYAGGIWNNGNLTMVNCVVSGNQETGNLGVGGILQFSDTGDDPDDVLNLINCTITANDGTSAVYDDGIGGLSVINGTANIYNTIVYGNTGDGFSDIDQTTVITEIKNSCIGNLSLVTLTNPGVGNIATNPGFVGSIVNATHPYAISNTSPAADAGDNTYNFEATDIRGGAFDRTINKTTGLSGTIDMGAYEFSGCVNPTVGGTIAAAQNGVTPFNPLAFTSSVAASGQSGTVEYKWQSSITSNSTGFSDIASSNADTYDAGALTVTTWFKRLARVSCTADWTGAVESNVIEVTVVSLLPVSGIELGGTTSDKQVKLSFKALNEHEMGSYTIERSADGTSFTKIGSLQASNANQASASYSFADNQPIVGNNYYRIKGSSINGQTQFSNVVVVKYGVNVSSVTVVPNPIEGRTVNLKLSQLAKGNYHISVSDAIGRSILKKEMLLDGSSSVQLGLPSSVKAGNYFVKVDGLGNTFIKTFIIQ